MRRVIDGDAGNVVIITALLMTTLLGFLALTVDVGSMMVRQSSLQTGADAAALAIAKQCADYVTTGGAGCSDDVADDFLDANAITSSPPVNVLTDLRSSYAGKAGRITVVGSTQEQLSFAAALGLGGSRTVRATATARWGPLTAEDAAFPLSVCNGALPPANSAELTLATDPAASVPPVQCAGSLTDAPLAWVAPPDNPTDCTVKATLLPSSYLSLSGSPPTGVACDGFIDELLEDIRGRWFCHWSPRRGYHCNHPTSADERTRVLAVFDASAGTSGGRPTYSLVAFEFTGARFGPDPDREAHQSGTTAPCDATMVCIRGRVRTWNPPTDGPIADPSILGLAGIDDTTVLDVRLVD